MPSTTGESRRWDVTAWDVNTATTYHQYREVDATLRRHLESLRGDLLDDLGDNPPEYPIYNDPSIHGIQQELLKKETKDYIPGSRRTFNYRFQCQQCGRYFFKNSMARIVNKKYQLMCKSCAHERGFVKCNRCGGYTSGSCPCGHKKYDRPTVETYNWNTDWKPFKEKTDAYLFGIEIEVELTGHNIDETDKLYQKPWVVYKWDGSISDRGNGGFEIVTMPLGWEWMHNNSEELDELFKLAKMGLKSKLTNTCGMHVHINKDIFTTFHLYKFYQFHYLNPKLLHYMSGRSWDNMQKWATINISPKRIKKDAKTKTCNHRHSAVNLKNPDTVEVRIFRGTLSSEPFWRNIEFVKAVCDYTRYAHHNSLNNIELFKDYVRKNSKEFPHLDEFLNDKIKGEILCA